MENNKSMQVMSYKRLLGMMLLSFAIMYTVMFLNVDKLSHIYLSITRTYMTLLMVSPMAIVMMLMMRKMYPNKRLNAIIILSASLLFVIILAGLRTQTPIGDIQYMKAMIPHHSSAILVSKNADLKDPEVKKLAEDIIESQEKEIAEMKVILQRLER